MELRDHLRRVFKMVEPGGAGRVGVDAWIIQIGS